MSIGIRKSGRNLHSRNSIDAHPSATSSTIITANPAAAPSVPAYGARRSPTREQAPSRPPRTSLPPRTPAGTAEPPLSATPERESARPASGSGTPDRKPHANAFLLVHSSRQRQEIIAPSGMFCIAMPSDSEKAPAKVIPEFPDRAPASATPTAIPSGIL